MTEPEQGNNTQHRRDLEVYNVWKRKNSLARIALMSTMDNDVKHEYRKYEIVIELWVALKERFGGTSLAKLRKLTIRFDTYKKRPKHNIRQHLKEMSNMISELKKAGHELTEKQVQAVIHFLYHNWEHMKVHLTHNTETEIKTFDDIVRHLELEED